MSFSDRNKTACRIWAAASLLLLQACTPPDWRIDGKVTRYLKISRGHFNGQTVMVPANEPFMLAIDATDRIVSRLTISSPEAGLRPTLIRVHAHGFSPMETHQPERTQITLGPLPSGRYHLICECQAGPSSVTLIAAPLASSQRSTSVISTLTAGNTTNRLG